MAYNEKYSVYASNYPSKNLFTLLGDINNPNDEYSKKWKNLVQNSEIKSKIVRVAGGMDFDLFAKGWEFNYGLDLVFVREENGCKKMYFKRKEDNTDDLVLSPPFWNHNGLTDWPDPLGIDSNTEHEDIEYYGFWIDEEAMANTPYGTFYRRVFSRSTH